MTCSYVYKGVNYSRPEMIRMIKTGQVAPAEASASARQWLKDTLGLTDDQIEEVKGLIDGQALGRVLSDGRVLLSPFANDDTAYEEAFHRVYRFMLTAQEQDALLKEAQSSKEVKAKLASLKGLYPELSTEGLLEEMMAKDFVTFMQTEQTASFPPKQTSFFQKILDFFKTLLGINRTKLTLKELNRAIAAGEYASRPSIAYQVSGFADSRVSDFAGDPAIKHEIVQNLATRMLRTVASQHLVFEFMQSALEVKDLFSTAVRAVAKELVEQGHSSIAGLLADDVLSDNDDIRSDSVIFDAVVSYFNVMGIKMAGEVNEVDEDVKKLEDIDEIPTSSEEEANMVKDRAFNKVSFEFDPRSGIKRSSQILLHAVFDEEKESTKLGILKPLSYSQSTGVLFSILSGLPADFDIVSEELRGSVEKHTWIRQILKFIGPLDSSSVPEDDLRLAHEFIGSFTKNKYTFIKGLVRQGRIQSVNLASDDQSRKYANLWRGRIEQRWQDPIQLGYALQTAPNAERIAEILGMDEMEPKMYTLPITEDTNETVAERLFKVRDLVVDGLKAGVIPSKLYSRQPTNLSKYEVRGSIISLATVVSMYGKPLDLMLLNSERKRIYGISLHNYQTQVIGRLNWIARKGKTIEEREEMMRKYLPHLANELTMPEEGRGSIWLNKILNGIALEFEVFDGAQARKMIKSASKVKEIDMLLFHMNSMEEGRMFAFKHGDRSTIFSYRFDSRQTNNARGYSTSLDKAVDQLLHYVEIELKKQVMLNGSSKHTNKVVNWNKRGKLGTLAPFVNKANLDKFVKQGWGPGDVRRVFSDDVRKFLLDESTALFDFMKENSMLNEVKIPSSKEEGADKNVSKGNHPIGLDHEVWRAYLAQNNNNKDQALKEAIINSVSNHAASYIEQTLLFTGDPANYSSAVDFFKRVQMQSSTGDPFITGRTIDQHINMINTEDTFGFYDEPGEITYGELKISGFQSEIVLYNRPTSTSSSEFLSEVFTQGLYNDYVSQGYSEADAKKFADKQAKKWVDAYDNFDENDGQSYINIFFWREYEKRANTWNDEKENTFQLELAVLASPDLKNVKVWVDIGSKSIVSSKPHQDFVAVNPFDFQEVKDVLKVDGELWFSLVFDYASVKKPQYTGPYNKSGSYDDYGLTVMAGRKTSYAVLMPSIIRGTNLEKLNKLMLRKGVDSIHMDSAAKYGREIKGEFAPEEAYYLYDENGQFNEKLLTDHAGDIVSHLDMAYQKDQLAINNKPKDQITNSTQSVKLMFANLFSNGTPKDYTGSDFKSLSEEDKLKASDIYSKYATYRDRLADIVYANIEKLTKEIGGGDARVLADIIKKNAEEKAEPLYLLESIEMFAQQKGLELLPNWGRIENLLYSIVSNNVVTTKRPGDGKAQFAVTMWESGNRTTSNGAYQSSDALKFYTPIKDDSGKIIGIEPAECIIPLPPKMIKPLLRLAGTSNLVEAIEWYNNQADWKKILMKGLRIPNQQLSFNDVLRVKKFTLPTKQSFIVLPSEVVVKSGSDFDIDKIQLYMPELTKDGLQVLHPDELSEVDKVKEKFLPYNYLLGAEIDLMLHPSNMHHLLAPSSDAWIKNDLFGEIMELKTGTPKAEVLKNRDKYVLKVTDNTLYSLLTGVKNGVKFLESKSNIGIVATSITAHSLGQPDGVRLGETVGVRTKDGIDPYSTKLMFETTDANQIGSIFDRSGNLILDNYSGVLTSQVDGLKDNYAPAIGINEETMPVLMYLMRNGVSPQIAVKLFNIPLVEEYVKAVIRNNSLLVSSNFKFRVANEKLPGEVVKDKLKVPSALFASQFDKYVKGIGEMITEEELDAAIKSGVSSVGQTKMLAAFVYLRNINIAFREYMTDLTADTKPRKNRDALVAYEYNYINLMADNVIPGLTHRRGFLKPFYAAQNMYNKYDDLYIVPNQFIDAIAEQFTKIKGAEEMGRIRRKITNDFILFVLQNFHPKFSQYKFEDLFVGENSVARQVLKNQKSNYLFENLLPMINEYQDPYTQQKVDILKLSERGASVHQLNDMYNAFKSLSVDMQEKLILVSLNQAGLGYSPFSLDVILDAEMLADFTTEVRKKVNNLLNNAPEDVLTQFSFLFKMNNPGFLPYSEKDAQRGPGVRSEISEATGDNIIYDHLGRGFFPFGNQYFMRYNMKMVPKPVGSKLDQQLGLEPAGEQQVAPKYSKTPEFEKAPDSIKKQVSLAEQQWADNQAQLSVKFPDIKKAEWLKLNDNQRSNLINCL